MAPFQGTKVRPCGLRQADCFSPKGFAASPAGTMVRMGAADQIAPGKIWDLSG